MNELEYVGPLKYLISGGFGGMCTVLIGHPLDTIKVRLQTLPVLEDGKVYGTLSYVKFLLKKEGLKGLYKGMATPLFIVTPIISLTFMGYKIGKQLFKADEYKTFINYYKAGMFAGLITTILDAPGERVKCLLQIQNSHDIKYRGPIDCVKQLYAEGGMRSIYRGTNATLLRNVPSCGFSFLTYEYLKKYFSEGGIKDNTIMDILICGGVAGVVYWTIAMPFDMLKSRLQTAPDSQYPNGLRDVLSYLLKTEGIFAFYKGFTPVLMRAFTANSVCFAGFELCKNSLKDIIT